MTKQTWTAAVSALLFVALAAVVSLVPVPFVSWSPGATVNLFEPVDGQPGPLVALIAARLGRTRLIDNLEFELAGHA